jgi:hypothetical protein
MIGRELAALSAAAHPGNRRIEHLKASEFDRRSDAGEDIAEAVNWKQAKRPNLEPHRDVADEDVFLAVPQLAERWHCEPNTIVTNWRRWGLKGTKFGKRLIFPLWSIKEVERRRLQRSE